MVPRAGSGSIMSVGAGITASVLALFDQKNGLGSMTSLVLLGPALDLAVTRARANWLLYVRFAAAGLAVNLLAFTVKMAAKAFEINLGGGRELTSWLSVATVSYPLCGLIAGLISGLVWFHWSPRNGQKSAAGKSPQEGSP
jgi:hypothetical protein